MWNGILRNRRTRGHHVPGANARPRSLPMEALERRLLLAKFGVIGDMVESSSLAQIASMVKGWNPVHIVTVGDNDNLTDTRYEDTVGQYFHDWMSPYTGSWGAGSSTGNRFWPAMGNHDWESSTGSLKYTNYFTLPGKERYYNIKLDNVEFFMYDSDQREPDGTSATSTQGQWLKNAMAASTAKWKLVIVHHAPYASGTEPDGTWVRLPFKEWGATAVLAGHQHNYERLNVDGVPYIINGPAGATTGGGWGSIDSRSVVRYNAEDGAMLIDAGESSINFKFINRLGATIDQITVGAPVVPNTTFIPTGASWKYLDNGSNQGTAWRGASFSDSTWKSGDAQLGYGDGDEATVVGFGSSSSAKFITTYFRRAFSVPDASSVSALSLRLLRDDGAVVYLNGTEVFRSNMPTGTIAYNTLASSAVEDNTYYTTTINAALLVSGNNVIAVEVHQSDAGSSDLSFDFSLLGSSSTPTATTPAAPSGLTASAVSATQIDLSWSDESNNETGFRIERSTDNSNFGEIATVAAGVRSYSDGGRSGATRYYYRVRAYNGAGNSAYTSTASAVTPDNSGAVYLSDIPWVSATNGYGPVERDTGNGGNAAGDGPPITLNGVVYPKGLGAHANSTIIYNLNNAYSTFLSDIGVDDRQTTAGSVIFRVYLDNTLVYDSGVMGPASATKRINLNTTGRMELKLVVTDAGDGNAYDHGDWAGARLIPGAAPGPAAPSAMSANAVSASAIQLSWVDSSSNEHGFRVERSSNGIDFSPLATLAAGSTSHLDSGLPAGTKFWYRAFAFNGEGDSASSSVASATTTGTAALPSPWQNGDIGSVAAAGSASSSNGTFTVQGSGSDVWANADSFHFVYQPMSGDGVIVARVTGVQNTNAWAKAGVMFRETLAAGSRQASMHVTPSNGTVLTYRATAGGSTSGVFSSGSAPEWLRVVRSGNTFTASRSEDGNTWTQIGSIGISMSSTVYVGLIVSAKSSSAVNTSTFTNVSVVSQSARATQTTAPQTTFSTARISAYESLEEEHSVKSHVIA